MELWNEKGVESLGDGIGTWKKGLTKKLIEG
jgi:hypothetical protein